MNFIGRKEELNTLEKEFHRDGSFVVIYGGAASERRP